MQTLSTVCRHNAIPTKVEGFGQTNTVETRISAQGFDPAFSAPAFSTL